MDMDTGIEIGIDLGTTNSSLAAVTPPSTEPRSASVSPNDQPYDTIIRTRLTLLSEGSGLERVRSVGSAEDPGRKGKFLSEFKPYFREPWLRRKVSREYEYTTVNPVNDIPDTKIRYVWEESQEPFSREELVLGAGGVFQHLFSQLDPKIRHDDVSRFYLGLPFNTWSVARRRMLAAAVAGGLAASYRQAVEKVRFIPEAVAASSTVPLRATRRRTESMVLIFDFGGGTLDLAVLRYAGEVGQIMEPAELLAVGGLDFAGSHIDRLILAKLGLGSKDVMVREKLLQGSEELKIELSKAVTPNVLFGGSGWFSMSRQEFAELLQGRMEEIRDAVDTVLKRAGVGRDEVDFVYTAGGSSLLPQVRVLLSGMFGGDEDRVFLHNPADDGKGGSCERALTAVCRGLTLSGRRARMRQKAARSYHVLTADGDLLPLLGEGTPFDLDTGLARGSCDAAKLPSAGGTCTVALYEGYLGQFQHVLNLTDIPLPPGKGGLRLHLELGVADAFPRISAESLTNGARVPIRNVQDLGEAEFRRFIESDSSAISSGRGGCKSPVPPSRPIRKGDRIGTRSWAAGTVTSIRDVRTNQTVPQTHYPDLSRYCFTVQEGQSTQTLRLQAYEIGLYDPETGALES